MTAILGAVAASATQAAPVVVALSDQSISAGSFATATASYQISNDGRIRDQNGGVLESWLLNGAASNYEVIASQSAGTSVSGTLGSWLNCATTRIWSVSNGAQNNSVLTGVIAVQIRDVATHTVKASASITLSAESDSRSGGGGGGGIQP